MAEDSQLPALISETLPEPQSFDGWDAKKLLGWLREATLDLISAEKWTEQHRLNVGMGLHLLRDLLGDGPYGQAENELAEHIKVSARTLRNWRALYEKKNRLKPPGKAAARSAGQKRRHAGKSGNDFPTSGKRTGAIEATAEQVPNTHLTGLEPDGPVGDPLPLPNSSSTPRERAESRKDENKAIRDLINVLLATDVAAGARAAKRKVLAQLEGWAKRAQQADPDNDGSRVVLLAADLVARFPALPSEPFDAGVNRAIRDLLAEVERARQSGPAQPAPAPPAATKVKVAATKKAPKPPAVKRPKPGEPCPHPVEAHDGLDMSGVTCTWCGESALTIVSLLRMGERAMAAAK